MNSLQLLTVPKDFSKTIAWGSSPPQTAEPISKKELGAQPFLLVAGLGQEHKLGRWLTVKEGAVNQAMVVVFAPP